MQYAATEAMGVERNGVSVASEHTAQIYSRIGLK
jgi:hypothetical protein